LPRLKGHRPVALAGVGVVLAVNTRELGQEVVQVSMAAPMAKMSPAIFVGNVAAPARAYRA
jgi:hypothetical protein